MTINISPPRRIVTGLQPDGRSYFARVEEVEPLETGPNSSRKTDTFRVYAWDNLPVKLPVDGKHVEIEGSPSPEDTPRALRQTTALPAANGVRVTQARFRPRPPGAVPKFEDYGGWHWHDTMVVQVVIAGEIVMLLDDGTEQVLRPGDTVIQMGTNHAWDIRNEEGAAMTITVLPGVRTGAAPPEVHRRFSKK